MVRQKWSYDQLMDCPADVLNEIVNLLNKEGSSGDYGG